MTLHDDLIHEIAAETDDARTERTLVNNKLTMLETGLKILNRLNRHKPTGR